MKDIYIKLKEEYPDMDDEDLQYYFEQYIKKHKIKRKKKKDGNKKD